MRSAIQENRTIAHAAGSGRSLESLASRVDNSLLRDLTPSQDEHVPSTKSRAVMTGHYVPVSPEPLESPELVAVSSSMCSEIGLDDAECSRDEFKKVFSGSGTTLGSKNLDAWSTPYGVSVNGRSATDSPFGPWGYGDGRAMSIAEVVQDGYRWELQLKGAGRTPFSRNFDGRLVLRSAVREFLACEAMHALGVPTTRALSLFASTTEKISRPWYSPPDGSPLPSRPAHAPSCLSEERATVLCRCASSFLRVGHVELFALRDDLAEFETFLWHVLQRDYPHLLGGGRSLPDAVAAMFEEFVQRQAGLVAKWLSVGYVHGNMNSDNCLLSGLTMDYGPFAFMEAYEPSYQPFTSDAEGEYAFARQPAAMLANVRTLASVLASSHPGMQTLSSDLERSAEGFWSRFKHDHDDASRRKLGLASWDRNADNLYQELLQLMQASEADFTMVFRLLVDKSPSFVRLSRSFSGQVSQELEEAWRSWLQRLAALVAAEARDPEVRKKEMEAASPKYVPRNWMLFEAYEAADRGVYAPVRGMLDLLSKPFDEQPDFEEHYFRPTPPWARNAGGIAFMS